LFAQQVASEEAEERGGLSDILDGIITTCDGNILSVGPNRDCKWWQFCQPIVTNQGTNDRVEILKIFDYLADKCQIIKVERRTTSG